MSIELKRHHRQRLKAKRRILWGRDISRDAKVIGQAVNTPTPCSCWMCGNDRRYFGKLSLQERRQMQRVE